MNGAEEYVPAVIGHGLGVIAHKASGDGAAVEDGVTAGLGTGDGLAVAERLADADGD